MTIALDGFESFAFDAGAGCPGGRTRVVYRRGQGPAVLLPHELPGMTPECVEVEGAGHSVLTMDFKSMELSERERVWGALTGFLNERLKG